MLHSFASPSGDMLILSNHAGEHITSSLSPRVIVYRLQNSLRRDASRGMPGMWNEDGGVGDGNKGTM